MKKYRDLQLGTDPELFVTDLNGEYVHPEKITKGTKKNPVQLGVINLHQDGAAVEFSIPPASTAEEWDALITLGLSFITRPEYKFHHKCAIELPREIIKSYPELSEIGCSPDLIFHNGECMSRSLSYRNTRWRMSGGHIHVGCGAIEDEELLEEIIKDLDINLLDWFKNQEWYDEKTEKIRQAHYGMRSVFRSKSYGFEYRSPSNGWIFKKEDRINVFHKVQQILKKYMLCGDSQEERTFVTTEKSFR
tara:strand:+ start:8660 stop:9403 length:744 start_codon:yes stop_codon:yes gene_type:complete